MLDFIERALNWALGLAFMGVCLFIILQFTDLSSLWMFILFMCFMGGIGELFTASHKEKRNV